MVDCVYLVGVGIYISDIVPIESLYQQTGVIKV